MRAALVALVAVACASPRVAPRPSASALALVPRPRAVRTCPGSLRVDARTRIEIASEDARPVGEQLADWFGLPRTNVGTSPGRIVLSLGAVGRDPAVAPPSSADEESYAIDVGDRAVVRAPARAGLFWGAQTLAQLAGARRIGKATPPGSAFDVPCVAIEDAPRYPFRAMHLDVARHFFPKDVVERYVDLLAYYRFNVFHWHLTDDQGFRFEVKKRPELRDAEGYTQDEARAVVRFARERQVTVMPEIEMPGHARAILAVHPELSCTGVKQPVPRTWGVFDDVLCAGNEGTFALLEDVLGEVTEVFPSRLVHIGGDEVPAKRWTECPKCNALMKARGIGVADLEGQFLERAADMVRRRGRRPVVWDEAYDGKTLRDAIVLAWQSRERGEEAMRGGRDVIMAPHDTNYFNIRQAKTETTGHEGSLPWTRVRTFDPGRAIGGEGALWTEFVTTPAAIDAMVMPRMAALAEALWSGPAASEADFAARFTAQRPALDASGVNYFVEPPAVRARSVFLDRTSVTMTPPSLFPDGRIVTTLPKPEDVRESTRFEAFFALPSGRRSAVVRGEVVKETPRPAVTPTPGVTCAYYEGPFERLPDFERLAPLRRAAVEAIGDAAAAKALRPRDEHFAMRFDAFVRVPETGVYRFVARADDGVRIVVDGEAIALDDGSHEPRETDGEIALAAGAHRLRVEWFQGEGGKELATSVEHEGRRSPLDLVF